MNRIYLDNNATTMADPQAVKEMAPFFSQKYGNPNSLHDFGRETHTAMALALDRLYRGIGAGDEDDIVINSCATEGNNSVFMGVYYDFIRTGKKKRVIVTQVEHPSVSAPAQFLQELGVEVVFLPVNEAGVVTPQMLREALTPDTALVSVMLANNETGLVFPVKELALAAHEAGALFHTDAVQAIGKMPVDVQDLDVDYLTFSAHKFHGPKGIGALYARKGRALSPFMRGGEQMHGLRAGTVNMPYLAAMGKAIELAQEHLEYEETEVRRLRDKLEAALLEIPDVIVVGHGQKRTPNTILAAFQGVEGEAFLWDLNKNGIAASTGSACSSEDLEPNPTFKAMRVSADLAHTGIRFSLSRYNTEEEIDQAIAVCRQSVARLRAISMAY